MVAACLHHHTMGSGVGTGCDGYGFPEDGAKYAKELGLFGLAATDHGNMYYALEHYAACKKHGIVPVLGIEAYYQPVFFPKLTKEQEQGLSPEQLAEAAYQAKTYHLTVLAKSDGYSALCQMLTEANKHAFYRRPIFTDELLAKHCGKIIVLSGCISGYIAQHIKMHTVDGLETKFFQRAYEKAVWFKKIFGDDFYFEVMPHDIPGQYEVNSILETWSDLEGSLHSVKLVITDDSHFPRPEDHESQQVLLKVRKAPQVSNGKNGHEETTQEEALNYRPYYIHSEDELLLLWTKMMGGERGQQYLYQSYLIAKQCQLDLVYPLVAPQLPGVEDQLYALQQKCARGAVRLGLAQTYQRDGKTYLTWKEGYEDRFWSELNTLVERGFVGYILLNVVNAEYAREQKIPMIARGSVCGSLIAYLTGITNIDPIRYRLKFELFIRPGDDDNFPDIDNDVADIHKKQMVAQVNALAGSAVQLCTFGTYATFSLCNELKRVLQMEEADAKRFKDTIEHYTKFEEAVLDYEILLHNPDLRYIENKYRAVKYFCDLYGQFAHVGTHAAGVVLFDGDITERLPIVRVGSGDDIRYVTGFDMTYIEKFLGLLKVDYLGSATQTAIAIMEQEADWYYSPVPIDGKRTYNDDDLEDPAVLEAIFWKRDTQGIMQFETQTPTNMAEELQPKSIAELGLINGWNRPLNLKSKAFKRYLKWRAGKGNKPITYQEDVVDLLLLAGFDWGKISYYLKLIKRGQRDKVLEQECIDGLKASGTSLAEAQSQVNEINGGYGFKESHAISYSHNAARQALIKYRDPLAFFLGTLQTESDRDKQRWYEIGAAQHGVNFLLPHVNGSVNYAVVRLSERIVQGQIVPASRYIQQGLTVLKGVKEAKAEPIIREREAHGQYLSRTDFLNRVRPGEALIATLDYYHALIFDANDFLYQSAQYTHGLKTTTLVAAHEVSSNGNGKYRKKK